MKILLLKLQTLGVALGMMRLMLSCKEDFADESSTTESQLSTRNARVSATLDHPGRTLAANCFQCHGTNGYGLEHLAGESASEIVDELMEMQTKNPRAEIMNAHAKAYTTEEIKLIADYFSQQ